MQLDGISTAMQDYQVELIMKVIDEYNVTNFIELGLYRGGLAHYMMNHQKSFPDFHYNGFELNPGDLDAQVKGCSEITLIDAHGAAAQAIIQRIIEMSDGAVFIFSDTFDKPKGMSTYAPMLRPGDLIMGHDYPGELSDAFLTKFGREHPNLKELDYRDQGVSLWLCQA